VQPPVPDLEVAAECSGPMEPGFHGQSKVRRNIFTWLLYFSDISLFYQSITNLFYPLLLFGLFYTLFHFSFNDTAEETDKSLKKMLKKFTHFYWWMWLVLAVIMGIFVLVKAVSTSIGWVAFKSGESLLWGREIPAIPDGIGLGCLIAVGLITISLIIFFINGLCIACGLGNSDNE
ncbi:MAG: hypothetical protein JSU58_02530, partial [Dehalococcoidales bacterium]